MSRLLFWLLLPIWLMLPQPAGADSQCQYGYAWNCRWDHSVITTDDPTVSAALRAWGVLTAPGDDIIVDYRPNRDLSGWANPQVDASHIVSCYIVFDSGLRGDVPLMIHEVGHCLGLSHSTQPGDVMTIGNVGTPSAHDLQRLHELYPAPHRLVIPL